MLQFDTNVVDIWKKIRNEEKVNWMSLKYEGGMNIVISASNEGSFDECCKELQSEIRFVIFRGYNTKGKIRAIDLIILWVPDSKGHYIRALANHHLEQIVNHLDLVDFILLDKITARHHSSSSLSEYLESLTGTPKESICLDKSISDIHRSVFKEKMSKLSSRKLSTNEIFTQIYAYIKEFLRLMDVFWKLYVQPMSSVNPEYHQQLFTNVFNVMDVEKSFYKDIVRKFPLTDGNDYSELFDQIIEHCTQYKNFFGYANSYSDLVKGAKDLSSYPQFISLNRKMESELQQKKEKLKTIYEFLRFPLSHVLGYQKLIEELVSVTPQDDKCYEKLNLALHDLQESAIFVDLKDQEIELAAKTIEISNRFLVSELRDETKRQLLMFRPCSYKKERGTIALYTDCVVIFNASSKQPVIIAINQSCPNIYIHEKKEKSVIVDAGKKKFEVSFSEVEIAIVVKEMIEGEKEKRTRLSKMEFLYKKRVIYSSWLQKEGGGRFSYSVKNRLHVLTADHIMSYYEEPEGKPKGSYSVQACTVGKGRPMKGGKRGKGLGKVLGGRKKKVKNKTATKTGYDCWFYIETDTRVYGMIAPDPLELDTWVRILTATGCYRKDIIEGKEKEWHDMQISLIRKASGEEETEGEGDGN